MVKYYNQDGDLYLLNRRGTRGKIGNSNEEMFIFQGQTFIFSVILIFLWITKLVLVKLGKTKNIFAKVTIFIFRTLFSLAIFDIEFFSITEVAMVDFTKVTSNVVRCSYVTSLVIIVMLTYEFCNVLSLMNYLSKYKISRKIKSIDKLNLNYDEILFLDEMTGGLDFTFAVQGNPIIVESFIHILFIQLVIVTL